MGGFSVCVEPSVVVAGGVWVAASVVVTCVVGGVWVDASAAVPVSVPSTTWHRACR